MAQGVMEWPQCSQPALPCIGTRHFHEGPLPSHTQARLHVLVCRRLAACCRLDRPDAGERAGAHARIAHVLRLPRGGAVGDVGHCRARAQRAGTGCGKRPRGAGLPKPGRAAQHPGAPWAGPSGAACSPACRAQGGGHPASRHLHPTPNQTASTKPAARPAGPASWLHHAPVHPAASTPSVAAQHTTSLVAPRGPLTRHSGDDIEAAAG